MITKYFRKIKRIRNNCEPQYIKYCGFPIEEKIVLVEGGQGTNINGNMFAMLKELETNPRWKEYTVVFTVVKGTYEKAKARMEFYGFEGVKLTIRNSKAYCRYLATAKYLMTDNSFPPYFNKREEQVFLNTWHGTPLKTLGKANKSGLSSLANVQKNYLMSDYALFPNEFTRNVFMQDYDLRHIFPGKTLIANYPRNYIFYDAKAGEEIKNILGLSGKKVFAYMPTWRDAANNKQKKKQLEQTCDILKEFDEKMDEDTVLLVNLHFLLASQIDCDEYKHVKYFDSSYDTYEILNACDGLITDYSSVFFDYAITGKKVILFAYDKEEYLGSRGLYMPFEELPFPIVEDIDSVIEEMKTPTKVPQDFLDTYCTNGSAKTCEQLFELMVTGKSETFQLEDRPDNGKKLCLLYAGAVNPVYYDIIGNYIKEHPEYNHLVVYRRTLSQQKKDEIDLMGEDVSVYGLMNAFQFTFKELVVYCFRRFFGIGKKSKILGELFRRESMRLFYGIKPERLLDFSQGNLLMSGIISRLSGKKYYVKNGEFSYVSERLKKKREKCRELEESNGFECLDYSQKTNALYLEKAEDGQAHSSWRINSKMKNILPLYFNKRQHLYCFSMFKMKSAKPVKLQDVSLQVGEQTYPIHFIAPIKKCTKKHFGIYWFKIPMKDVINFSATTMVAVVYKDSIGLDVKCHIHFYTFIKNMFLGLRGPMCVDKETNTVAIFRQSPKNRLNVYVRSVNYTDAISQRIKQLIAAGVAILWHTKKARKLVLLYEKNSAKYEESASVLFEELIDSGYEHAYFVVDKNYEFLNRIPEKYRNHIVYKFTFKHYLYFFRSHTFIGTEAIAHSIDLKTFNKPALAKIGSKNMNYVFLQHGVMYMVSLDSESRKMFRRKVLKGKYRVVVSSQAEADHFTTLGRHKEEDIYITGLPKFDRNQYNEGADKIVIMPTWRPWEINEARSDFSETPYFKMLMRIYEGVPDKLKEKVIILPHPLIVNELNKMPNQVSDKIVVDARYDDILKDTAVLITDYSSIAYDAFYRGARVVFYWEEKDYCMAQYGPTTKLMLNEDNVYGDFAYSVDELSEIIERNYYNEQTMKQKERYSELVTYHDGQNTKRLIDFLKEDHII